MVFHGKVCIELLFFDICFAGTFTLGSADAAAGPAVADLLDTLLGELTNPAKLRAAGGTDPWVRLSPAADSPDRRSSRRSGSWSGPSSAPRWICCSPGSAARRCPAAQTVTPPAPYVTGPDQRLVRARASSPS